MRTLLLFVCAVVFVIPAQAQIGFGVRAGLDFEPDAFFAGAHVVIPNVANVVDIEPSLEVGFGSSDYEDLGGINGGFARTADPVHALGNAGGGSFEDLGFMVIRANLNAMYPFDISGSGNASFYPIVGLGVYSIKFDDIGGFESERNTEVGLNLGGGVSFGGFGIDATVGIGDIADIALRGKFTFGR